MPKQTTSIIPKWTTFWYERVSPKMGEKGVTRASQLKRQQSREADHTMDLFGLKEENFHFNASRVLGTDSN